MKYFTLIAAAAFFGRTSANVPKPDVTLGLNVGHDTTVGSVGELVPNIKWKSEPTTVAGFDVQGGLDVTMADVKKTPKTIMWGVVKRDIDEIEGSIKVQGSMDATERDFVNFDIETKGFDTKIKVSGNADLQYPGVNVDKVQVTKELKALGGKLNLNPSYSLSKGAPDAVVGYSKGPTSFQVDAQKKQLTVTRKFDGSAISPTISAAGDLSLSYSRVVADGELTTTWTPDDSIKVQFKDNGGWHATVVAPLEGYYKTNSGIKVSMKRNIEVPL